MAYLSLACNSKISPCSCSCSCKWPFSQGSTQWRQSRPLRYQAVDIKKIDNPCNCSMCLMKNLVNSLFTRLSHTQFLFQCRRVSIYLTSFFPWCTGIVHRYLERCRLLDLSLYPYPTLPVDISNVVADYIQGWPIPLHHWVPYHMHTWWKNHVRGWRRLMISFQAALNPICRVNSLWECYHLWPIYEHLRMQSIRFWEFTTLTYTLLFTFDSV
jgi:hypothetical protein